MKMVSLNEDDPFSSIFIPQENKDMILFKGPDSKKADLIDKGVILVKDG